MRQELKSIFFLSESTKKSNLPSESLNPFRKQYPDRVLKLRKAAKEFHKAECESLRKAVAVKYGYNYD